jgi:hypothetical protein
MISSPPSRPLRQLTFGFPSALVIFEQTLSTFTHPLIPSPHLRVANVTTRKLNPSNWGDITDHDRHRRQTCPYTGNGTPLARLLLPRSINSRRLVFCLNLLPVWHGPSGRPEAGYGPPSHSDERITYCAHTPSVDRSFNTSDTE